VTLSHALLWKKGLNLRRWTTDQLLLTVSCPMKPIPDSGKLPEKGAAYPLGGEVDIDAILLGDDAAATRQTSPNAEVPNERSVEAPVEFAATPERNVWVHVYDADSVTPWLNWAGVSRIAASIHHAGVEIAGTEWAFQYFDDAWGDPSISGVVSCEPKQMDGYNYQESYCLGPTPLSAFQIEQVIRRMSSEWPSNSYHISRRNCLTFAHNLVTLLKTPKPFPEFLLGFSDGPTHMPVADVLVDHGWGWVKWWNGWNDQDSQVSDPTLQNGSTGFESSAFATVASQVARRLPHSRTRI